MSKLEFRPEDFAGKPDAPVLTGRAAAAVAQRLFDRWLAEQPVVYQRNSRQFTGKDFDTGVWTEHTRASDTHRARIVAIEPLEKKP